MIKLLAKAGNEVLSHCRCVAPMASVPGQLDCPWCGCGWLISCTECRKAFTFARVVEVDTDYETFVRQDRGRGEFEHSDDEIRRQAEMLEWMLEPFSPGQKIVYLDGAYFALDEAVEDFEGVYASHNFSELPHALALKNSAHLNALLGDKDYWFDRERPDRNGEA
jgi:hypothetical protein